MTEKTISTSFKIYEDLSELPAGIQHLMAEACKAREKAYAPYSNFHVGAAILLENDQIVTGNNQENASYPSGLCAERTAIYYAGAQFPHLKIHHIAICAKSATRILNAPIPPCGACRQTIAEYEIKQNHSIEIYFMGETGKIIRADSLGDLLPLAFDSTFL